MCIKFVRGMADVNQPVCFEMGDCCEEDASSGILKEKVDEEQAQTWRKKKQAMWELNEQEESV